MPAGTWQITNTGTAGGVATVSQVAPTGAALGGNTVVRLRQLACSLGGAAAGIDRFVVRDGASGTGTIIWSMELSVPANGSSIVTEEGMDLRASVGNALTIETVAGVASDLETVNAAGDFVPAGQPWGI